MWNSGLYELGAGDLESETAVKPGSIGLCVQAHAYMAAMTGPRDQCLQQQRARAFASPFLQYRHPSDVAVGQQASRPYRRAVGGVRERVVAQRILLVPFQFQWHALLAHEHQLAYMAGLGAGLIPVAKAYGEWLRRHGAYNTRLLRE